MTVSEALLVAYGSQERANFCVQSFANGALGGLS